MEWSRLSSALRRAGQRIAAVVAITVATCAVLGLLGGLWWFFDLFAHFRLQYAVVLSIVTAVYACLRRWRIAVPLFAVLVIDIGLQLPLYYATPAPAAEGGIRFELTLFNVNADNSRRDEVADFLRAGDSDVIVVLEVTAAMAGLLEETLARPPHDYRIIARAREDSFGIALLTRVPVRHAGVIYLADSDLPAVEAVLEVAGQGIAVLAVHPPPPLSSALAEKRDRMIAAIAAWREKWSPDEISHVVVAGDLNATPWSAPLRRLDDRSDLVNSLRGFGYQATWPRSLPPLRIPIDHVLHGPSLTTLSRSVGPWLGSDHRAVTLTLGAAR